jgi:hypothetical protein
MRDISDNGARLTFDGHRGSAIDEIPSEFILSISKSGNVYRRCKLVWRRNNELGVHFSLGASERQKRRLRRLTNSSSVA